MHAARTRFADDIVAEFLPPKYESQKVIIFCDGMPSMPNKKRVLEYFAKHGFWAIHPRYRGTWESAGVFLKDEPTRDILDVVGQLERGFVNLYTKEVVRIENPEVYVVGTSFGGPAALFVSRDKRVKKVIALSPVVDWSKTGPDEPLDELRQLLKDGFGEAYRYEAEDWKKLGDGTWYNPIAHAGTFDGKKIMIMHAGDDRIVLADPVRAFAEKIGCTLHMLKKGGHLSSRIFTSWRWRRTILKWLK